MPHDIIGRMDTSSDVLSKIAQFKNDTRELKDHINTWLSSLQLISHDIDTFKDVVEEKPQAVKVNFPPAVSPEKIEQNVKQDLSKPVAIDKEELKRQMELAQKEELKRVGKLAVLYGSMKPDEAVGLMEKLEDNIVLAIFSKMEDEQVAKILARFEPDRGAELTKKMYFGNNIKKNTQDNKNNLAQT